MTLRARTIIFILEILLLVAATISVPFVWAAIWSARAGVWWLNVLGKKSDRFVDRLRK